MKCIIYYINYIFLSNNILRCEIVSINQSIDQPLTTQESRILEATKLIEVLENNEGVTSN